MYCQIGNVREHFTQGSYYLADYPALAMRDNPNNQEDIHELSGYPNIEKEKEKEKEKEIPLFDKPYLNTYPVNITIHPMNYSTLTTAYKVGPGSNKKFMTEWKNAFNTYNTPVPTSTLYPTTSPPITKNPLPTVPFMPYVPVIPQS